jgi:DNA primase
MGGGGGLEGATLSERIKARVMVVEFVSQYVDLKPAADGAVGLCLIH